MSSFAACLALARVRIVLILLLLSFAFATPALTRDDPSARYFGYQIWPQTYWTPQDTLTVAQVHAHVDSAIAWGANLVLLEANWGRIETSPGAYDFSLLDAYTDYIVDRGLALSFTVNISNRGAPAWVLPYWSVVGMRLKNGLFQYHSDSQSWTPLNWEIPIVRNEWLSFYAALAAHEWSRYRSHPSNPDPVLGFEGNWTPWLESMWGGGYSSLDPEEWLDYSPEGSAAFRAWAANRYGSVEAVNALWGTRYAGLDEITAGLETYPKKIDWMKWSVESLRRLMADLETAVRASYPTAHFMMRMGGYGGTVPAGSSRDYHHEIYMTGAGWSWFDNMYVPFYYDLQRTSARGKPAGHEYDSMDYGWQYCHGAPGCSDPNRFSTAHHAYMDSLYAWAGTTAYRHGLRAIDLSHWRPGYPWFTTGFRWAFQETLRAWAARPATVVSPATALYLCPWEMYQADGANPAAPAIWQLVAPYESRHAALTQNGAIPIDVVLDGLFENDPSYLLRYMSGGIVLPMNAVIATRARAALLQAAAAGVPFAVDDPDSAGVRDEYGRLTVPFAVELARLGVPSGQPRAAGAQRLELRLELRPNPSPGPTRMVLRGAAASGPARLTVFDPAGRAVWSRAASLFWDGRNQGGAPAPSGIYFVRVEAGGRTATARLAVIR